MRVAVQFRDESQGFEVAAGRLIDAWDGPAGLPEADLRARIGTDLEQPRDFPPLRRAVVPGDRVVVPVEADLPGAAVVLDAVCSALIGAGVDASSIHILTPGPAGSDLTAALPPGVTREEHDPDDTTRLAYLASTAEGRRVYLNRHLTDADFVVPVGQLGFDPILGYQGPWGVIFPGLSDTPTRQSLRSLAPEDPFGSGHEPPALAESIEVSWLLGTQFHVGIVPGVTGVAAIVAGLDATVLHEGKDLVDRDWTFRPSVRAGVVVAGVGRPGRPTSLDELAEGLTTAGRLVRRGGKIVLLSRAEGPLGPAWQRLSGTEPGEGLLALRGLEGESDYRTARQLARVLAWADVYLFSSLPDDLVEDLAMIPLSRPEEARRLVESADSCLFVNHAELTRAEVADDEG